MKPVRMFLLFTVFIFALTALGQGTKSTVAGAPQAQQPTIAAIV